jgi:hypothetical protein
MTNEFFTAIDLRARAALSELIDADGALMIGDDFARLEDDGDIAAACNALQCSEGDLNDELFAAYQGLLDTAEAQIGEESKQTDDHGDYFITTWQNRNGFYGCAHGTDADGLYWETDDAGGFATREEAKAAVVAQIAAYNE